MIDWNAIVTCVGLVNLAYYYRHKPFKRNRSDNWREWADSNFVGIVHAAVLIPQWGAWITGLVTRIIGV